MTRRSLISSTLACGAAVLLVLNFMFAHLQHRIHQSRQQAHAPVESQLRLPSSQALRVTFGGFETLAADIVWIWSLVYYGEQRSKSRNPKHLEDYATTIVELDPFFYPVYRWFSTTYINTHYPPSHAHLERVSQFLERGMKYFPTDYRLPKTAGLNYLGYSSDRSSEVRLEELERAIGYLQRASRYEGAPDHLPFTVAWMYQRKRQLERKLAGDGTAPLDEENTSADRRAQIEFFADMYYIVDSQSARRRIRQKLKRFDREDAILERGSSYLERLEHERRERFAYLPVGLWTLVVTPRR